VVIGNYGDWYVDHHRVTNPKGESGRLLAGVREKNPPTWDVLMDLARPVGFGADGALPNDRNYALNSREFTKTPVSAASRCL